MTQNRDVHDSFVSFYSEPYVGKSRCMKGTVPEYDGWYNIIDHLNNACSIIDWFGRLSWKKIRSQIKVPGKGSDATCALIFWCKVTLFIVYWCSVDYAYTVCNVGCFIWQKMSLCIWVLYTLMGTRTVTFIHFMWCFYA